MSIKNNIRSESLMPGSHYRILKILTDFQNVRDPTHDDKKS